MSTDNVLQSTVVELVGPRSNPGPSSVAVSQAVVVCSLHLRQRVHGNYRKTQDGLVF